MIARVYRGLAGTITSHDSSAELVYLFEAARPFVEQAEIVQSGYPFH
jgi:hypothetical protein